LELGLIDGLGDLRSKMQQLHGPKVRLRAISTAPSGLLARFRRIPGFGEAVDAWPRPASFADQLISALETRALWSRFGL
jgi:hypothetical protein